MATKQESKDQKTQTLGALAISVIVHVTLFLFLGSYVVFEAFIPRDLPDLVVDAGSTDVAEEDLLEEDVEVPTLGEETEVDPTETASAAPPLEISNVITTQPNDFYSLHATSTPVITTPGGFGSGFGSGTGKGKGRPGKIVQSLFGSSAPVENGLEGYFYDLKQTPDRKPTRMNPKKYGDEVKAFVRNWNIRKLKNFYRVENPLYLTQLHIPIQTAKEAPQAFKVENEVKPSMWIILYQGEFIAPKDGAFRFVGYADDILVVNAGGKNVLDGSRPSVGFDRGTGIIAPGANTSIEKDHEIGNGVLAYGKWMTLKQGQSKELKILLGERPGGDFGAFLFIEEKGAKYKKQGGRPLLPVFNTQDALD